MTYRTDICHYFIIIERYYQIRFFFVLTDIFINAIIYEVEKQKEEN